MMKTDAKNYDIVVVGAGMVGAAAALGLVQLGLRVALVEQITPEPFVADSPADLRVSAISCASVRLLESLNAWQAVLKMRCTPYRRLETWEQPGSEVRFSAHELGLPELGFMVENRILQLALWQQFANYEHLQQINAQVLALQQSEDQRWQLTLSDGTQLNSALVVAADGANSPVRRLAGIGITGWQYRQHCMLINVTTAQPEQDVTWQQFFPSGPRAFLPLFGNYASLVWYDSPQRISALLRLPMPQLTKQISEAFPARLGAVEALQAAAFPLVRRHAQHYCRPGLVLVGDAAHTINPLAGQGANLGYRDVACLIEVIQRALADNQPWHSDTVLRRYSQQRRYDNLLMQSGMDLFYTTFSNDLPLVKVARNLALMAAQRAGKLKQQALKYALGL